MTLLEKFTITLKEHPIAGILGYWYIEELEKKKLESIINTVSNELYCLKAIKHKRVHFCPLNELVVNNLIEKNFKKEKDNFQYVKNPFKEQTLHLIVSKKYPNAKQLIKRFNKALASMKKDKSYNKILEKHGVLAQ